MSEPAPELPPPEPAAPDAPPPVRVRKRRRVRVKVVRPRHKRLVEWWYKNERAILLWGGFILAVAIALIAVLKGYIRTSLPALPQD